jgi:hypothetical protein
MNFDFRQNLQTLRSRIKLSNPQTFKRAAGASNL